jgi:nicotinamidase-related amidase
VDWINLKEFALLVIDVQVGNFTEPDIIYQGKELLSKISRIMKRMRQLKVPIIYIKNNGFKGDPDEPNTPGWEIHPDIAPINGDIILEKSAPDAFYKTPLKSELILMEVSRIMIVGLQTEFCIDTTCRRAFSLGFRVTLIQDAHSTWDSQLLTAQQIINHHNAVLGDWLVKLKTTSEVLAESLT